MRRYHPHYGTQSHTHTHTHTHTRSIEAQQDIIIIPNRYEAEHQSRSPLLQWMESGSDNGRLKEIQFLIYILTGRRGGGEQETKRKTSKILTCVRVCACVRVHPWESLSLQPVFIICYFYQVQFQSGFSGSLSFYFVTKCSAGRFTVRAHRCVGREAQLWMLPKQTASILFCHHFALYG